MKRAFLLFVLCFCAKVYGQQIGYLCVDGWDFVPTITLEDTSTTRYVYIDTSLSENSWQTGIPQKTIFSSAYSPVDALVTDTVNPYPINNLSVFYMKMNRCYDNADVVTLSFQHQYDTDTLADGGKIEISLDNGLTFSDLSDAAYLASFNVCYYGFSMGQPLPGGLYPSADTVGALSSPGFSGSSNGWKGFYLQLFTMGSSVDTIIVRFVFASDSADHNREGWMIDDINWNVYIVGIDETAENKILNIYPNPVSQSISVNDPSSESFDFAILDISGRCIQTGKINGSGNIDVSGFTPGIYWIRANNGKRSLQNKFVRE